MLAVCSMVTLLGVSAYAEEMWYTCTVTRAGAWGDAYVRLTDRDANPIFVDKWFSFRKSEEQLMSAVAKSALNSKKAVRVKADINRGVYPRIDAMHLDLEPQARLYLGHSPDKPFQGS